MGGETVLYRMAEKFLGRRESVFLAGGVPILEQSLG
jgi:hypothetical protein